MLGWLAVTAMMGSTPALSLWTEADRASIAAEGALSLAAMPRVISTDVRLLPSLHLNNEGRIGTIALPGQLQQAGEDRRYRHLASTIDYYPAGDAGFHFSMGLRRGPHRTRMAAEGGRGTPANAIFVPRSTMLPLGRTNIGRLAPAMMVGWSTPISSVGMLRLDAGAIRQHGGAARMSTAMIAQADTRSARWTSIGTIAQVSLRMKF